MDFHSFKKILIYSNSMGLYMIHNIIAIIKIKHIYTEGNYRKYVIYIEKVKLLIVFPKNKKQIEICSHAK